MPADPTAGIHQDGGLPFGSQTVTIGAATFIADDISLDRPAMIITGRDELNRPFREVQVEDVFTGSATLQLATVATAPPIIGAPFTVKEAGGASLNVKVSKVGSKFAKDKETLVNIEFRQRFAA